MGSYQGLVQCENSMWCKGGFGTVNSLQLKKAFVVFFGSLLYVFRPIDAMGVNWKYRAVVFLNLMGCCKGTLEGLVLLSEF